MPNYYKEGFIWNGETGNTKGLPRPYITPPNIYYFRKPFAFNSRFKRYLHKIVPIPWQSIPFFDENFNKLLSVNVEHEIEARENNLCGYCGLGFKDTDIVIRWKTQTLPPSIDGSIPGAIIDGHPRHRVYSDSYPHHLECMRQARVFCPFMRTLLDDDFEIGEYAILENNFKKQIEIILLKNTVEE